MELRGLVDYDICNYKIPSIFVIFPYCSFKCDHECGHPVCQNSELINEPIIEITTRDIIARYLNNPLTHALVCGGLEPFDSKEDLYELINAFRNVSQDPIIIYTGYNEYELEEDINKLAQNRIQTEENNKKTTTVSKKSEIIANIIAPTK